MGGRARIWYVIAAAAVLCGLGGIRPDPIWGAKDTLTVGLRGDASFLDPIIASDGQSYEVEWSLFDCLVEYDENLAIKLALAERWDASPDGLSYTFHLRRGVDWQDGRPFTADDVAFWMAAMLNPKTRAPSRAFFGAMAGCFSSC